MEGAPVGSAPEHVDVEHARRRHRPGHWVLGAVIFGAAAWIAHFAITNENLEWPVVGQYLFSAQVLQGLLTTLVVSVVTQLIGMAIGTVMALLRLSAFAPARWTATAYVTLFRSVPVLLQLVFWFNLAYLVPTMGIGIPLGPTFFSASTNDVITPPAAAVLGLSLAHGAYMTEIVRGSLTSVGVGQRDAARALGYTPAQTFLRVVLPQAVRVSIPPTGSQFIIAIHGSSLVSVIAVSDLLFSVQNIYERTYQIVPLLLVAVIWYLVVVLVLTFFQQRLERRFSRGHLRDAVARTKSRRPEAALR
ncbi:amino acid ABC transporter permease [Pseudonocardia zijingensis]|uniref:Amino acid ABC transporter permease n=1 Tax=Pseudonocardia zijingensis TaxID=153376 RepID=A0ABP4AJ60_9PSEU